jgi:hypothetical protein
MIGNSMLLSEVLELDGMPSRSTIYRWLREHEDFAQEYALAREQAADCVDEQIAELIRTVTAANATAIRTKIAALQWRAGRLYPQRYGGSASLAVESPDAAVVDVGGAQDRLMARFAAIAERIATHDDDRFFATQRVADAVRTLESERRIDLLDEGDRALVVATVVRAISPFPLSCSGAGEAQGSNTEIPTLAVAAAIEPDVAEHNSVNGIGDVPSQNSEPHAGCAVPLDVEPLVSSIPAATVEVPAVPYPWDAWMWR